MMQFVVRSSRMRGWSLVELSISLAVAGLIGHALWKAGPHLFGSVSQTSAQMQREQAIVSAIDGFVLRNHRLPCPDASSTPSGTESCGSTAAVGWLPWAALGLDAPTARGVRYGVYRSANGDPTQDADLTRSIRRLPLELPLGYVGSATANVLDVCQALRVAGANPGRSGALALDGMEAAWAVAFSGENGRFDGANDTAAGMDSPMRSRSATYDDKVVAVGILQWSARLGCPTYMGQLLSTARSAIAAEDMKRNADFLSSFRTFSRELRQTDLNFAGANLGLATLDLVNSIATSITAVVIAGNSAGIGAGVVVPAILAVGASAAALVAATVSVATSALALQKAQKQELEAQRFQAESLILLTKSVGEVLTLDRKGVQP